MFRIFAVSTLIALFSVAAKPQAAQELSSPPQRSTPSGTGNQAVLILPFHNVSKAPGLDWIGEAFSEVLGQRIESPSIFVINREDRLDALDRVGIPGSAPLSHATLLRIAEQMDVDFVVLGSYDYDGNVFTAKSQLLNMRRLHLSPVLIESGSLLQLVDIQAATAWDVLHEIQPTLSSGKREFVAETKNIRLDALENYVRGVLASTHAEKVRRFKEAARLNPNYTVAMLGLGKSYFDQRDYSSAIAWLGKIPPSDKHATEANFFLGLAAYYSGNLDRAEEAFHFVASRLPLTEVFNNIGVVEARRGKYTSVDYLQKAVEADPVDEDYHFNLGISLARMGNSAAAARQLKEALNLSPSDEEARAYLETIARNSPSSPEHKPLERLKQNYNEASFRQLAFAIENAQEAQMANADPKKHAAMYVDQGKQQLAQGFYEEARDHFHRAIALDPENGEAHLGLAQADLALNDLGNARSELDPILQKQPTIEAYVTVSQIDIKENKLAAADQHISEALRMDPANATALQLKQQLAAKMTSASQAKQ